jgi:hypothetical protein
MGSFFPKALVYKEWKQQWSWAAVLFVVGCTVPLLLILRSFTHLWDDPQMRAVYVNNLRLYLSSLLHDHSYNGVDNFGMLPFGAAVLGATVLAHERSQGGLWYTLTGPVTRREVLRVKALVGCALVAAIVTVCASVLAALSAMAALHLAAGDFVAWWARSLLVSVAMFMTGLLAATMVGHIAAACIAGLGIAVAPSAIGLFFEIITVLTHPNGLNPDHIPLNDVFGRLSPLHYAGGWADCPPWLVLVGLALWSMAAYVLAQRLFFLTAVEHMGDFFIFPTLWKWFLFLVSLAVGLVLTAISLRANPVEPLNFAIRYAVSVGLCWFLAAWLIRIYRKKFLEV